MPHPDLSKSPAKLGKERVDICSSPVYDPTKGTFMLLVRFHANGVLKTVPADGVIVGSRDPDLGV